MKILGIDTSTEACSAALVDGHRRLDRHLHAGQKHSQLLLPMIDSLLAEAGWRLGDLDAIAFGAGPGSFTGLRVACGVAQGLAWGAGIAVVPVGSLLATAHASRRSRVVVATDARMHEIYFAAYERSPETRSRWTEACAPQVVASCDAPAPGGEGWFGVGSGFALDSTLACRMGCTAGVDSTAVPTGLAVAELGSEAAAAGRMSSPDEALPLYVRDRVALTIAERAAGTAA